METTQLKIQGMTCPNCAAHVKKALASVPGVVSASVSLATGATVQHTGVSIDDLKRAVVAAGDYSAEADPSKPV
jgi:mercuric reductase